MPIIHYINCTAINLGRPLHRTASDCIGHRCKTETRDRKAESCSSEQRSAALYTLVAFTWMMRELNRDCNTLVGGIVVAQFDLRERANW